MAELLIVAATWQEVFPISAQLGLNNGHKTGLFESADKRGIHILITGVGMVNTAFMLGPLNLGNYKTIINAGICGAFNRQLIIGQVVCINSDLLSEMGAEDDENFITYSELNLGGTNRYQSNAERMGVFSEFNFVNAITVNKVHGNNQSIAATVKRFKPDVESMEGAAFFRACEGISGAYVQIRAISNYVEKRNKSNWNIPLAVENLNRVLTKIINSI